MPSDLIPRIPVSPSRQPQGGLLQGLNEGLDLAQKENALRREMALREEMDMRGDERRHKFMQGQQERGFQQQVQMERERTTGQMMMEQQKADQEQQAIQAVEALLNDVWEPEFISPQTRQFDDMLGRVRGVVPKFLQNIVPKQAPRTSADRPPRTAGQILASDMSESEIATRFPTKYATLKASRWGQAVLDKKPKTPSAGMERIPWRDIQETPGAFDDTVIDGMISNGIFSPEVGRLVRNVRDASIAKIAAEGDRKALEAHRETLKDRLKEGLKRVKELKDDKVKLQLELAKLPLIPPRAPGEDEEIYNKQAALRIQARNDVQAALNRLPEEIRLTETENREIGQMLSGRVTIRPTESLESLIAQGREAQARGDAQAMAAINQKIKALKGIR